VRDADRALRASGFFVDRSREASLVRTMVTLSSGALRLFAALPRSGSGGRVLLSAAMLGGEFGAGAQQLLEGLESLGAHLRDFVSTNDMLLSVARRTASLLEAVKLVLQVDSPTHVTFAEPEARGGGAVGASPVEVGPFLAERLWSRRGAVVMTSATLSAGGNFAFVRHRLGVPESARELTLPSPFDFGAQAGLYIPRRLPEPREPAWMDAAADEIARLVAITAGGAFVLCTSVRVMRALHDLLHDTWRYPSFLQGQMPKRALLERFREAGNGVLFATLSFWEGVDVPGHALRLVIMDKLPFEAPNDPVTSARIARLTAQGHDPLRCVSGSGGGADAEAGLWQARAHTAGRRRRGHPRPPPRHAPLRPGAARLAAARRPARLPRRRAGLLDGPHRRALSDRFRPRAGRPWPSSAPTARRWQPSPARCRSRPQTPRPRRAAGWWATGRTP
jgi:ATP-dependent DNA helicase DinG